MNHLSLFIAVLRFAVVFVPAFTFSVQSAASASGLGNTYYVAPDGDDGRSGTLQEPWRTPTYAGEMAHAGDTVIFLPGDYSEPLIPINSGRPDAWITFRSAERRQARLIGSDAGRWQEGWGGRIRLDQVEHIRIEGFHVEDISVDESTGGWLWGNKPRHIDVVDCSFTGGHRWVLFRLAEGRHVRILDSDFARMRNGGDMVHINHSEDVLVEGNSFAFALHTLVAIRYGNGAVVRGNVFHSGTSRNFENGDNTGTLIENNIFTNAYNGGRSAGAGNQTVGNRTIIRMNQVFRNFGPTWTMASASTRDTMHNRVYHNVFYGNYGYAWAVNSRRSNFRDLVYKNNIFARNDPYGSGTQLVFDGGGMESVRIIGNAFSAAVPGHDALFRHGRHVLSLEQAQSDNAPSDYRKIFQENFEMVPEFANPWRFDFSLAEESPLRMAAAPLTRTREGGRGRELPVEDVYSFFDGFGVAGQRGDLIAVGGSGNQARVLRADTETGTLHLDRELRWSLGDSVSLPWSGSVPDVGVFEHGDQGRATVQVLVEKPFVQPGTPVTLRAVVRGAVTPPLSYRWQLGDGSIAEGETVTHTYEEARDYGIRVRVATETGESLLGVGYVVVEEESDSDFLIHSTFNADDNEWWKHWQFYRGRRGTGYAYFRNIIDKKTGEGYIRIYPRDPDPAPLPAFIHPRNWDIDRFPFVFIRYRIKPGTPVAVFVRPHPSARHVLETLDSDQDSRRYYFAGTKGVGEASGRAGRGTLPEAGLDRLLIDDGEWHEIRFDVREIRRQFPDVQFLQAMHIGDLEVDGGAKVSPGDEFFLDEVSIGR